MKRKNIESQHIVKSIDNSSPDETAQSSLTNIHDFEPSGDVKDCPNLHRLKYLEGLNKLKINEKLVDHFIIK